MKTMIICSGAALAFFTKSQAPVNQFFDKIYLGWLIRCIYSPRTFIPRYMKAFSFIYTFFKYHNTVNLIDKNDKSKSFPTYLLVKKLSQPIEMFFF